MVDFQIRLTEMPVGITAEHEEVMRICRKYICEEDKCVFHVSVSEDDMRKEAEYFNTRNGDDAQQVLMWQLERSALYRKIAEEMIDHDRILIHGSALSMDGNGYLFTAPSGTGKSTHAALWRTVFQDRVVMINDDKPLVWMKDDQILVYGTPWDGKHHLSNNIGVPLKGICRIIRCAQNSIQRVSKEEGMTHLLEQTFRSSDPQRLLKTLEMLKEITEQIPVYDLYCNMETDAAITAYEQLIREDQDEVKK